ncbi:MAG: hypothetical protein RMH77_02340 [Sulfolobales archaeon]|nr:hypothetical protein [Sulfolobales archaeon]MCX8185971.1 hypothetical protein [Sulfolobales archaeon]MDW7969228.1 hypothetical protein [Sulfolobales archaeon]
MGRVRRDPIVLNRMSVISHVRALRPKELTVVKHESPSLPKCPFCQGNEDVTPPATLVVKYGDSGLSFLKDDGDYRIRDWLVRIFPNKYPIFSKDGFNGYGHHEVVVEHPQHDVNPYNMTLGHLIVVLTATLHRIKELHNDPAVKHVYLFKNFGGGGGASITHSHTQLTATSIVLPSVYEEIRYSKLFNSKFRSCPYCELIRKEVRSPRLVYANKHFIVVTSYAPRNSHEVWILPLNHSPRPLDISKEEVTSLADALLKLMRAYNKCLGNIDFNLWLHMSPKADEYNEFYHWHIEVLPATVLWGGLEKGGNVYVVTTSPEDSARELRDCLKWVTVPN